MMARIAGTTTFDLPMDFDLIKALLSFAGGLLAFISVLFTFVTARWKDAETPAARARVVTITLESLSLAFNVIGFVVMITVRGYLWALLPFAAALIVQLALFLRRAHPAQRAEIATFTLMVCGYTFLLVASVGFHFLDRLVHVLELMSASPTK